MDMAENNENNVLIWNKSEYPKLDVWGIKVVCINWMGIFQQFWKVGNILLVSFFLSRHRNETYFQARISYKRFTLFLKISPVSF